LLLPTSLATLVSRSRNFGTANSKKARWDNELAGADGCGGLGGIHPQPLDAAATAADGLPYCNTYTWYFAMRDGKVTTAIAFFDTREFDEFWHRVKPR
jgi:hypothetical protein